MNNHNNTTFIMDKKIVSLGISTRWIILILVKLVHTEAAISIYLVALLTPTIVSEVFISQ